MNKIFKTIAAGALASGIAGSANAMVLTIEFNGADIVYSGTTICDAGGCVGSNTALPGDTTSADALETVDFLIDGTLVKTLTDNIFLDLKIGDVSGIADSGATTILADHSGFGFDLLTETGGILLDFDVNEDVTIIYNSFGGSLDILLAGGPANIFAQLLPFDLIFTDQDDIVVSLNTQVLTNTVTSQDGFITSFEALGGGVIGGPGLMLPEPAVIGFLGFGLLGMGIAARRRKKV